jgi:rhamnosyltransferase
MKYPTKNNTAVVIVTYNPEIHRLNRFIQRILDELEHIYIFDNSNYSYDLEEYLDPRLKYIRSDNGNIGLMKAQNHIINNLDDSFQFILTFDQDSYLCKNYFSLLVDDYTKLINNGCLVGAIGPLIYDRNTLKKLPISSYNGLFIKNLQFESSINLLNPTFIISSGSLISKDIFNLIGNYRDDFFIAYGDVEWCLRASHSGYPVYVSSKARLLHEIGEKMVNVFGRNIPIHSPLRRYYLTKNSLKMLSMKHVPLGYKIREILLFNIRLIFDIIFDNKKKYSYIKYHFKAFKDFINKE